MVGKNVDLALFVDVVCKSDIEPCLKHQIYKQRYLALTLAFASP